MQYLRYLGCSVCAAAVNFLVGQALVQGAGMVSAWEYPLAVGAGYCCGMVVNFFLSWRFTFGVYDRTVISYARTFLVVALSGLFLTAAIAWLVRTILHAVLQAPMGESGTLGLFVSAETIGQIVAIGVVSIHSFLGHRYLTFNRGIRFQLHRLAGLASTRDADR
jgi:putative flippase GtrA